MRRKIPLVFVCVLIFQYSISAALGATKAYPEKPIQFLVGFTAGSVTDLSARPLAKVAYKYLGKPLVVVNMPGAASTVALNELVKSPPDGYTVALMTTSYKSLVVHEQKIPFDPKILKPVLGFGEFRQLLFVKGDSPYARVEDLVAYGRKNPHAIKYGHSGRGTSLHLQGLLFFKSANVEAVDVPFKGNADVVSAVIGGHILAGLSDPSGISQQIRAGVLKPVVTFTDRRHEDFPEVPTSREKGYADVSALNPLVTVCIHKETPPDRIKKLHDALKKAAEDPEFRKMLEDISLKSGYFSPETVEEITTRAESVGVPLLKDLKLLVE